MRKNLFKGGVHPLSKTHHGKTLSENAPLRRISPPDELIYPLSQHIGAPCKPVVAKGDDVKIGQKIAEAAGYVSANIYASVSGTVKDIKMHPNGVGINAMCIIVENDKQDRVDNSVQPWAPISELSGEDIMRAVKEAGLAGMGGAAFPSHVKLAVPQDKQVDTLILNGVECEPYLTSDHQLMLNMHDQIVYGAEAAMKALNVKKCIIAIENNKPDAIKAMKKAAAGNSGIEVAGLPVKYPQGAEKQLIYALTKREVPSGGLPADAGAVVMNVGTAAALAIKLTTGMPLVERIVTVSGEGINTPSNLLVKLGTKFSDLIEACDGLNQGCVKVLSGGPMMGITVTDLDAVVVKGTSGIVALTEEFTGPKAESPCIHCGRCVSVCPMRLLPLRIDAAVRIDDVENTELYGAMDCIECGACTYICPAKRQLTQSCRLGKIAIRKKAEAEKARKAGI